MQCSFKLYCYLRDLHSFPTRRSSDLYQPGILRTPFTPEWYANASRVDIVRNRSEEHTSELQSRFDLVCRLLLEKKKSSFAIVLFGKSWTHTLRFRSVWSVSS